MPRFRKLPVVIEAIRITRPMTIETREGTMKAAPGDWLVTGTHGEQYPVKNHIFVKVYEPADAAAEAYLERFSNSHFLEDLNDD